MAHSLRVRFNTWYLAFDWTQILDI